ncbi:MAG: TrkH family potassium uptake protein [Acidobacteria bacterium]|nr:TrkH family potassium uptake protein [Acidobacteriota bacterium]
MRPPIIFRYVGIVLLFNGFFLSVSAIISRWHHQPDFLPLLYSAAITVLFGIFPLIYVPPASHINNNEGLVIVVSSWLLSCVVGILPYILYGGEFTLVNAWFESVSGFTTTGSSILADVEALPSGLLFWRAATHWIGGIGIIVFVLAVIPAMGQASMLLSRSEISPLAMKNFQYRTRKTLKILLSVYLSLTFLETILLAVCGMGGFDALTHSFATIATGGFSTKNASVAYFDKPAIELVIIVFMILSGIHFGILYAAAVSGRIREMWRLSVVRFYIGSMIAGVILVALSIHGTIFETWTGALRHAAFQVVSLGTSTGFATTDTGIWPAFSILILTYFTLQCACSGSTSGGIKVERILIFWKSARTKIRKLKYPNAVIPLRMDNSVVPEETVSTSLLFIVLYLAVVFLSTLLLTGMGLDILSAFTGSAACMGNVGPGFGAVSSLANYSRLPDAGKIVLTVVMLLGRLEIFGLILLLSAGTRK